AGPNETDASPRGTSVLDTGLVNGTTNYYTASAAYRGGPDAGGESADSVQASAMPQGVTPTPTTTPTPAFGLVAAYGFNEGTKTTANDVPGNGNNGTISGATRTRLGKYGNAVNCT